MTNLIGHKVIIRSDKAGVFYGILLDKQGTEVELESAVRLWYWEGAASLSQLACEGTNKPTKCKFAIPVPKIIILEIIEIIPCTEKAITSIEGVESWTV